MITAPELIHKGRKNQQEKENFYQLPQALMDIVFSQLKDRSAQLRVMIVLLGTKPGFAVSESWMLDRTGLSSSSYKSAKEALVKMGWLEVQPYQSITVNIDSIYQCGKPIAARGEEKKVLPIAALGKAAQAELLKRAPIAADGNKPIATGGDKPNPALGNKPIAAGGSAPIAAGHIINNTDKINNSEQRTEKIIYEKKEGQQGEKERGPAQEPRPVSAASVQQLLNTGNKINWIDADNFEFNGRYFRIDRRLF